MVRDEKTKTSHTVQKEAGYKRAAERNWDVVGYFEDLDVSAGKFSPFERPDLAPWLTERIGEWDILILAKTDRLFRSNRDCAEFTHWAEQNHKMLVLIEEGIELDYRDGQKDLATQMMAQLFLTLSAVFAEIELKRIRARARDTRRYLNTTIRWAGGPPPYGYSIADHPEGGKALVVDPVTSEAVLFAAKMVIDGKSVNDTARALTVKKFPTPSQHNHSENSRRKTPVAAEWTGSHLGPILKSPTILGYKVTGRKGGNPGRIIAGEDGLPLRASDPILDEEEWTALQSALAVRSISRERTRNTAPLLGIAVCGGCRRRLYKNTGGEGYSITYYRCQKNAGGTGCGSGFNFRAEYIQGFLDENMRDDLGSVPMVERIFVKGEDHTRELERIKQHISTLRDEWDMGLYEEHERDDYLARLKKLTDQKRNLEALPQRADEWIDKPTGETMAEAYERMTPEERRMMLLSAGVKILCGPGNQLHLIAPPLEQLGKHAQDYAAANLSLLREVN